ncbi:uncharacterized protein EV154DRAFT_575548 [Mucor mucedo]|uniref:uncharacterized protein n=1 Tax=Mucor mucedo TaxID=29922 RepID=UPI00221FC161|nr:uncharacterized protein EV154DRAFT_575548 [Mucor mucedo]KAI7880886.1 hypothetical protein EV154DRAFT_575548 [Mucor mucedo]
MKRQQSCQRFDKTIRALKVSSCEAAPSEPTKEESEDENDMDIVSYMEQKSYEGKIVNMGTKLDAFKLITPIIVHGIELLAKIDTGSEATCLFLSSYNKKLNLFKINRLKGTLNFISSDGHSARIGITDPLKLSTNDTNSHPSPVAPNIRKDKAEGSTSTQSDDQHRKNRSWFVGEGDDNKPAMDRVKDFLLDNNGKYLDIWSGIPDKRTGNTTQGKSRPWVSQQCADEFAKHGIKRKKETIRTQIMNMLASYGEAARLFNQTGAGAKGDVPGVSMSEEFKKKVLETCPQYFELEPHLSDRFTDDSWAADTGTIQDKPFNKETFIESIHNKRSIDDVAVMYDELMERLAIETGANGNRAGRSESCSNATNDSEKSTSVAALETCIKERTRQNAEAKWNDSLMQIGNRRFELLKLDLPIETVNTIYEQEVELLKRGPLE